MAAGSIIVDLLMRTGSFETDTKRAEKALRELEKEAKAMGVAVGAAFAAVGAASAAMVKSAIDAADAAGETAQKVGLAVEQYTALVYAAKLGAVSQEVLGASLIKLTKNMSEAASGSGDAAEGFKALGLSVTNADGSLKSSDQMLTEIAAKFAGFKDGAEKTALAVALFGKSGAELIPMLNLGADGIEKLKAEAAVLGIVLSTEAAEAAGQFNDNLDRMAAAVTGVANKAAGELLPALNSVSEMLVDVAKNETTVSAMTDIVKASVGGLITVFQSLAVVGSDVGFVFMSVGREIGAWAAQIAALGRGDLAGFRAISDAVKADGERARAELDKFQARVMAIGKPGAAMSADDFRRGERAYGGAGGGRPSAPRLPGSTPKAKKSPGQSESEKDWAAHMKFRRETYLAELDAERKAESDALAESEKDWAAHMKFRREAFLAEVDAADRSIQESEALRERLMSVGGAMSENERIAVQMGDAFGNAMEQLVLGGASASEALGGLLKSMAQMVWQIGVMEPMTARIRALFGGGGGVPPNPFAAGSGGGFDWGSILGAIGSLFAARADGGPVNARTPYLIGERGPELFVPRTAGMVVPNHALGAAGGGMPTIINQTTGRVDRVQEHRMPDGGRALLLQELNNPNSEISRTLQQRYNLRPAR